MSPTWTGSRKAISSSAAVTAGPPLCRWATAPAVESASFTISPPWMLPRRFASRADMTTPSETRPYDGGTGRLDGGNVGPLGHAPHGSVVRMPDRPRNGGPEDGPDYTWLYGKGGKPRGSAGHPAGAAPDRRVRSRPRRDAGDARPAATRPTRASRRPPARPRRRSQPPVQPPGPPQRGRTQRPRFRVRYVFLLLLLWLVYLVVVPIVAWNKVDQVKFEPSGDRPATSPARRTSWSAATPARGCRRRSARSSTPAVPRAAAPTRSCCCTPAPGPTC